MYCVERNDKPRVETAHRTLVLLKLLSSRSAVSVTQASQALNVNASTAYRLLVTLVADDFAVQRSDRSYARGPALEELTPTAQGLPLATRLRPALEALFERTGETVHIATLVGTRIQHVDGIESSAHPLRFGSRVGVWLPAHIAAGGKALLADFPPLEINSRYEMARAGIRGRDLDLDLAALHEELEDVRDTRLAWNFEQTEPGIAALAISTGIIDGENAALSVAVPVARFDTKLGKAWSRDLIAIVEAFRASLP